MAKAKLLFCFIAFLLCIVACTSSKDSNIWAEQKRGIVAQTWCVANPAFGEAKLRRAIEVYCHQIGVDCSVIKPGGPCYLPNTVKDHASVVLDLYYKAHNKVNSFCPSAVAKVTLTNPSHGSCRFP